MASALPEVAAFIGKYTPEIAASIVACRRKMQAAVPQGFELVFDNYNALVFGYAASTKASAAVLSIAAYPRWVTLFFLHGTRLQDPQGLLQGAGKQVRSVRLASPDDLDTPAVQSLIAQALQPGAAAFAQAPPLTTVVKLVAPKQRPRRADTHPHP